MLFIASGSSLMMVFLLDVVGKVLDAPSARGYRGFEVSG